MHSPTIFNTRRIALVLPLVCLLAACDRGNDEPQLYELTGAAMGTTWSVKVVDLPEGPGRADLRENLEHVLIDTELALSTYISDSELSRFNASRSTGWIGVSPELCTVVDIASQFGDMSGGAFDVTVGPLVNLWGFGPGGPVSEPPTPEQIAAAVEATGHWKLHADCERPALKKDVPELYVDLSAFAKGYTVDKLAHVLDNHGVTNYLVELGGELKARGQNASGVDWSIAIEEPTLSARSVQTIVGLNNSGMATSGDYRNFFQHDDVLYSHTIDPRSGWPVSHNGASVTVVDESVGFADAMATALLVLGPEAGIEFANRHAIAAYYLIRTEAGIEARTSTRFSEVVTLN